MQAASNSTAYTAKRAAFCSITDASFLNRPPQRGCLGMSASFNSLSFNVNRAHVRKSGQILNQGSVRSILSVDRQMRQDGVAGSGAERVESGPAMEVRGTT